MDLRNLKSRFREEDWITMTNMHALPFGWENMEYFEFLTKRRFLMAGIIRTNFESL